MSRALSWRAVGVWALLAALPALPFMSKFYLLLAFDALLFGAIAMSLDLLIGYTGLVSFGHAAFFGLGAYASAVLLERGVVSLWACLLFAVLVVGLYALVVSYFSTARRGIYFALLTLIFAEVVYTFFRYTQTFGGSDGIQGVPPPRLVGSFAIDTPMRNYYLVLVYLGLAYLACRVLVTSHFGKVLVAIRERALGLRDARPHALDGVGRVHHHGHDRRARDARRPRRRRRVLRPAAGEGLVVRGLVLHRDRPGPGLHRPVHAQGSARYPRAPRRAAMARDGVVLEVDGVSKSFGALAALSNVSLVVQAGQIFSVIGPNGAGKSTLFNVVSGLHVPTTGRVRFRDREIAGLAPETINRLGVAKTFQITNIFPEISVFENVRVAAQSRVRESGRLPSLWRLPDVEAAAADLLRAFGLAAKRDEMAENLSHGEQRYLEICLALATEPTLLLLDEPTAGMTPGETKEATALIRQIASARGLTVLLIEHDMSVVMGISDRIAVLHFGEKIAEGAPEEIRSDPKVVEAYLGPPED